MFFMVPLQENDQNRFAFTWEGMQYTFTRLLQGYRHSPTLVHHALAQALTEITPEEIKIYQYIDDVLICGSDATAVEKTQTAIITYLEDLGLQIPIEKIQLPSHEVKFLGIWWKGGMICIPPEVLTTLEQWAALITQRARIGNPSRPGIVEVITDWPEGKDFGMSPEEEVTRAEEAPLYNKLPENERQYALFTDGSCRIVGKHRRWKAAVWSPTRLVAETAEGEGESSQFAEVKAIQLALDIAEREKWPVLYLYTDSWMVANALWGWLQQWKKSNWQRRGKPIWVAALWQDIAVRIEKLVVKVRHVDAHVPKSRATEEHQNNQQADQAAKTEVSQVDLDWQRRGELFMAQWTHDTSGHQGRDATYRWARDRGVDLTMDTIAQVIHECETCAAIKQAKRLKPLSHGGQWLKYKQWEAWQIDYITLPRTRQGKCHTVVVSARPVTKDHAAARSLLSPPSGGIGRRRRREKEKNLEPRGLR
ncbi:uncharacterized protein ACIBXB_005758 [Morphnus guianensis]